MSRPEESKPLQDAILAAIGLTVALILLFAWLNQEAAKKNPGVDNPTPGKVTSSTSATPTVTKGGNQ